MSLVLKSEKVRKPGLAPFALRIVEEDRKPVP
jgi:hypothetical protein